MNAFKIILFILFFSSCSQEQSILDYEKKVMDEIFVALVDSLHRDMRTYRFIGRPPPPGGYVSEEQRKEIQLWNEEMRKLFEINKQRIQNDTSRVLIIVYDTIYKHLDKNEDLNRNYLKNVVFFNDTASINSAYVIDLSQFSKNKKFLFGYMSSFSKARGRQFFRELRENPPLNHFGGVVSLSKISFDKERNYGVIYGGLSRASLNGFGCNIYIKKENEKWVIDKIVYTSIS